MQMIPNWHAFLVHFTVALTLTAAALYLAAYLLRTRSIAVQMTLVARWNLLLAAMSALWTFAAGLQAYYTVAHDALSHAAMTLHLKWAIGTLALLILAAALAWRERARSVGTGPVLGVAMVLTAVTLAITGYLGAENVYRHGIGVMRLPQPEVAGGGHAHGEGEEHGDMTMDKTMDMAPEATAVPANEAGSAHRHDPGALAHTAQAPADTVDAFFKALKAGEFAAAEALLDPKVQIFESGGAERSAKEYASHHMQGDAAFLKTATQEIGTRTGDAVGDLAWVATEQRITGISRDKPVDILSTETMVLRKTADGWRIVHIHWSSRPFKKD